VWPVSDAADDQASRQRAIDFARGSVRYEGFALSAEAERIGEQFVAGHLTVAEYVIAIKALSSPHELPSPVAPGPKG
jgi:hypothetical protein